MSSVLFYVAAFQRSPVLIAPSGALNISLSNNLISYWRWPAFQNKKEGFQLKSQIKISILTRETMVMPMISIKRDPAFFDCRLLECRYYDTSNVAKKYLGLRG